MTVGGGISLIVIIYFVSGRFGVSLPGASFMNYWLGPWYYAWIAAPLAILANVVFSLMSSEETPLEVKRHLAEEVHGVETAKLTV